MIIVAFDDASTTSAHFLTERALDTLRLAAVVVVHDARARRARRGWRRVFDRARFRLETRAQAAAYAEAHPQAKVEYDAATREVRVLGQRWPVPDGLTLVLRIDRAAEVGAAPVVATRTIAAPAVSVEPIQVDPGAPSERQRARVGEIVQRRREAECRAWGAALLADPEVTALVGQRSLERMAKGR